MVFVVLLCCGLEVSWWDPAEVEDVLESPELLNPGQCNYLGILNTISLQIE